MKPVKTILSAPGRLRAILPLALALMALIVTGCPQNEYVVRLQPEGDRIRRTLTFYCADGADAKTGQPNYRPFGSNELAAIAALYPAQLPATNDPRHVVQGDFTNNLPADVGGAGVYGHYITSLGEAGFYSERFRGNEDLAGMFEQRARAADQLTDLFLGWSRQELRHQPGYDSLRRYLDTDFRRDLKNLGAFWCEDQLLAKSHTNAEQEFILRFGQYLYERGYFHFNELPGLYTGLASPGSARLLPYMQRLVARKMGVPDSAPIPACLAFLGDETALEKSFEKYLAGTDLYRARLRQWRREQKLKPEKPTPAQPRPIEVAQDAVNMLLDFNLDGQPDHLTVHLTLPAAPDYSNGRWDTNLQQVVWDTRIGEKGKPGGLPAYCYAIWASPDAAFQTGHFGKIALTGDGLTQYCLWRNAQDTAHGAEWDAFLASLQPGTNLISRVDAFRFPDEPAAVPATSNPPPPAPGPTAFPRDLLKAALR